MSAAAIVILLVLVPVAFIAASAVNKPATFRIERRRIFAAAPEAVFTQINDLVAWQAWSPWAQKDPNAKAEFGATTAGPGAAFGWDGNRDVGKGRMTILEAEPPRRVLFLLEFEAPFKATNHAEFTLLPVEGGTELTWAMFGPQPLPARIMCLFFNMDGMVGKDFEIGLANLAGIVEQRG